jgi:hypothetical protein
VALYQRRHGGAVLTQRRQRAVNRRFTFDVMAA